MTCSHQLNLVSAHYMVQKQFYLVTNNLLLIASASNPSRHHRIFRHKQPMPLLSLLSITGTALSGLKYYLTNRQQLVALY